MLINGNQQHLSLITRDLITKVLPPMQSRLLTKMGASGTGKVDNSIEKYYYLLKTMNKITTMYNLLSYNGYNRWMQSVFSR
jgi:hypothetical protein